MIKRGFSPLRETDRDENVSTRRLEFHQQVELKDLVVAIPRDRPLLSRTDAGYIAGRKAPVEILGQRVRIIESQTGRQKVGQVVRNVELPTLSVQIAKGEVRAVDVRIN